MFSFLTTDFIVFFFFSLPKKTSFVGLGNKCIFRLPELSSLETFVTRSFHHVELSSHSVGTGKWGGEMWESAGGGGEEVGGRVRKGKGGVGEGRDRKVWG